jgi:hypothetical protein
MTFAEFKACQPARAIFEKLGLTDYLEAATSWHMLRHLIVEFNDPDKGRFVKIAMRCDGVASSGERVLLHAVLCATDFAWLADKLTKGRAWQRMEFADSDWRKAAAACIAMED